MKKIFTTAIALSFAALGFSQSLTLLDDSNNVVSSTIVDIDLPPNSGHTEEILVTNTSSTAKTYKVRRTILTVDAGDLTQFCWGGLCYGYTTNLSSQTLTCNPGDTLDFVENGFHAIIQSGPAMVTREVHYQFFDVANTNDTTGVTIRYNAVVGINESAKGTAVIGNMFPNPASTITTVKYDLSAFSSEGHIELHDMLGKKVKEIALADKQGTAKINVSDLNAGVYFYSFVVDNKAVSTKKLVISAK